MTTALHSRLAALMFGVAIADVTMDETVDSIGELIESGRRQGRTHQVATVNVDFLVNALVDEPIRRVLQDADLCIADGMPVVWGSRAAGMPLRERVAGADLVPALAARAADTGWHIHLFGSAAGTAERAAELLTARYPGLRITGTSGPFLRDVDHVDEAVLTEITGLDPDVLCVALGNPKQERFIRANRAALRTPVMIGVGGSLDLLVGHKTRAPAWMQRVGLEWVVRMVQEPGRLARRYARDAWIFFPRLFVLVIRSRRWRQGGFLHIESSGGEVVVTEEHGAQQSQHRPDLASWRTAIDELHKGSILRVSLEVSSQLQMSALAQLTGLIRAARQGGAESIVAPVSTVLTKQMNALGLLAYLDQVAPVP